MNKYNSLIIKKENKYPDSFYSTEEIKIAQDNLLNIIELRTKSVVNQINGNKELIESNINIDTLGTFFNSRDKK